MDNEQSIQLQDPPCPQEIKESALKELQSSLKELKEIYTSMQERLKELEVLADYEDIINATMEWVFTHCQIDTDGKFQVGDTQYTWISFLKYVINDKINLHNLKPNLS